MLVLDNLAQDSLQLTLGW